ncbi:hypothetical protein INT43_006334 [Umbelopsis isabellina]|uniref:Chromatin target of PRMT1 protein C-terminal domain-containing protein n=1 Tax=Mortierella isabellina TaxID=91625 RepID=A0A8H7PZ12_MORIS|nr:hypothetical protein INT43_006334 [Umbelopsis isabellina]
MPTIRYCRFSQIAKGTTSVQKGKPAIANRLGPQKAGKINAANIQNRLGKPKNAGIKKSGPVRKLKGGATPMEGVQRTGKVAARNQKGLANLRQKKGGAVSAQNKLGRNKGPQRAPAANGKDKAQDNRKKQDQKPKQVSKDDLDKSLDEYMMKDPKTAQARLDDELNQYLADGDLVMDM